MMLATMAIIKLIMTILVSWCFKPSQPQRITSGLNKIMTKEFIKLTLTLCNGEV